MSDPIAVYGAITGTAGAAAAIWTVWNGVRDRARIRMSVGVASVSDYPGIESGRWLCTIAVMNHGRRPVTISGNAGLAYSNGQWSPFGGVFSTGLPRRLDEGSSVTFWVYEDALVEGIRRQGSLPNRVLVNDDAGHQHTRRISKKYLQRLERLVRIQ
jgi:hypothetical protein